ncbi:NUMOD3 domain-containing DNA-binding protein [Candidatus Pacearchaeota archaeon]|jgi:ribosomal protein L44E|nr:NUMOD3 domain-containing DNA-binding protein [Candidatus Pacearchaeota archaeon]
MRKGQRTPDEVRLKMSIAAKGRIFTDEHRANISKSKLGKPAHNKGVTGIYHHTPDEIEKQVAAQMGRTAWNKGIPHKNETRTKMSLSHSGEKNPRWKGGISFGQYCPKFNREFKKRIRAFFEYRCVVCGKEMRKGLCCHHINYDKLACCNNSPVQFATLCHTCHGHTNGERDRWGEMLHRIIEENWNGKSYYTKEEYAKLMQQI